jgi:hypothetical protein
MVSSDHIILIKAGSDSIFRKTVKTRYRIPPLGLLELGSFLRMHGYIVQIVDLLSEDYDAPSLAARLRAGGMTPLVVGISVYTDTAPASLELAQFVKTVQPDTTVVVGGPHPAFCAGEMLACGCRWPGSSAGFPRMGSWPATRPRGSSSHVGACRCADVQPKPEAGRAPTRTSAPRSGRDGRL